MSGNLIMVVGPTASGKSALAVSLAKHFSTCIISMDSRQFYRNMSIGTAVPTKEELSQAKHYFIQQRDIWEEYSAGQYERDALCLLDELFKIHNVVIAVGGSGMYIRALEQGMDDMPDVNPSLRRELRQILLYEGLETLCQKLLQLDPKYYMQVDRQNPQRVMRALEVCIQSGKPYSKIRQEQKRQRSFNIIKVGISYPRDVLYERINQRVDKMISSGLEAEARSLLPFRENNALRTVGYSEMFRYFDGEISFDEAVEQIKQNTRHYAKRQMTWFRKDTDISWFSPSSEFVVPYIESHLK
ncbi:MAG: tRNA (adenosine(37)-N6)-dimethylallyltransferase MiaA [Alistipes sp.]|nr:tRNA (adenosine(37)-N6)-dimethylallyltransferase MiaA [Candidatus Alistipes equi]